MTTSSDSRQDSPGVRIPPPLLYVVALLIGIAVNRELPHPGQLPPVVRAIGWLFIGAWVLITLAAFHAMGRARTTIRPDRGANALVTDGVFRYTRNPMYVGLALLYVGVVCVINVPWALVLLPVVVGIIYAVVIRSEEAYLTRAFGSAYTAYRGRVRRWI